MHPVHAVEKKALLGGSWGSYNVELQVILPPSRGRGDFGTVALLLSMCEVA